MWGNPRVIPVTMGESFNDLPLTKGSAPQGGTGLGEGKDKENLDGNKAKAEGQDKPAKASWRLRRRRKQADSAADAEGASRSVEEEGPFGGPRCERVTSSDDQGIVEGSDKPRGPADGSCEAG
eukprot:CAMPEP_0173422830 /NCGR_PEP_ID=MMETSP1357-20121228/3383_1 /TAXON_ID=77926 /ORGANISM="Hemiselmis rufescens, Strain PCC563" /LENGTH=122 /DNA_ID=CAMNT_0014385885 /DNA_START=139 /DNA_END=504 /DNA_ORIENTATION=-